MEFKQLHSWNVNYKKAIQIQEILRNSLILKKPQLKVHKVAGTDVSFDKRGDRFFAGVVVHEIKSELEKIEEVTVTGRVKFPYIPGLLSFREAPILLRAFRKLKTNPDVILFDGQGIAHPRNFGLASHIGLILNKPSIGCAKSLLVGEYGEVENKIGAYSKLVFNNKVVGAVLRTKINTKPVFVSPGHKVNLAFAVRIVLETGCGYRIPEPIRQAHILINKIRTSY
jgi:deoxyribonuclease V